MRLKHDQSTTYMYKRGTPRTAQGGSFSTSILKEEASTSERKTPDFTLRHNANLIVRGTSLGTHHPSEGLSLQEQLHKIGRKIRTEVTTRAEYPHALSSNYTTLGPSYTRGSNPVVLTSRTRRKTHNRTKQNV
ncbi:hypothetical protein B296_00036251 [Ensete ventricosum]|uniref:Uncharacterized protein n=1 Tax=Ensete ventricosum TaxID=4639 RepID=A0A426XB56_ENSVE|nr:hypothetical protein B296_00036251 [Ensete ventricosum]